MEPGPVALRHVGRADFQLHRAVTPTSLLPAAMRLETRRTRAGSRLIALYELLKSWGLFVQDSWRMKPNLTVNMGLRWDFVSPNKDQLGKYHSMRPQDVYGPTGVGHALQPRRAVADRNL